MSTHLYRKDVAKIGWNAEVDLEVEVEGGGEPEKSRKSGEEIFALFSVGQKLRVDAVKKANQGRMDSLVYKAWNTGS